MIFGFLFVFYNLWMSIIKWQNVKVLTFFVVSEKVLIFLLWPEKDLKEPVAKEPVYWNDFTFEIPQLDISMWAEIIFYNFFSFQSEKSFPYKKFILFVFLVSCKKSGNFLLCPEKNWNFHKCPETSCLNKSLALKLFWWLEHEKIIEYDFCPHREYQVAVSQNHFNKLAPLLQVLSGRRPE